MQQVTVIILMVFFLFASSVKLLGWQKTIFETQLAFFHKYGLNRSLMFLVGLTELAGALSLAGYLLISQNDQLLLAGAGVLAVTSVGALFFHFRFDKWTDGVPAMVTLVMSAIALLA